MPPRPSVSRRTTTALAAASLVAVLAGCSSSASTSASATSAAVASTAPTSSGAAASPTAAGEPFTLLPETVLASLSPLVYKEDPKADTVMAASGAQPAVHAVFVGGISRSLDYQGNTVGGVELYRFNDSVPADGRAKFVPLMVQSFAQKAPTPSTLGTTAVQVADQARNTDITVVGWTHGQDIVIVWANGVPAAQQIAQQYINQSS